MGLFRLRQVLGTRDEGELVAKLEWRVKLVTEAPAGERTEVEVACLERDEQAGLADLGLRLAEAKQLLAAIQAEIVPAQVMVGSEHRYACAGCGVQLASKGYHSTTFHSLFGGVPVRVRRLLTCHCQNGGVAKSFPAFDLSELLPIGGASNAGTVRNRTMRVGKAVVQPHAAQAAEATQPAQHVVIGLICFCAQCPAIASDAIKRALAVAGVTADTPATVLSDGDAGLWRLQRETLPNGRARLVACRRAFRACAADGTWSWRRCADADLADKAVGRLECLMRQLTGYKPRRLASSPVATPTP